MESMQVLSSTYGIWLGTGQTGVWIYHSISKSFQKPHARRVPLSLSRSMHTLYLSWSGTQLSMRYFWKKEAVSSHFKVILQLHPDWSHQQTVPFLLLSFSTCWQMAPVMVTGKSRTMPRPRFSLFLCWLNNFNSFFSSSSRELQYWGYTHTHTHTHIHLQYCYSSRKTTRDLCYVHTGC